MVKDEFDFSNVGRGCEGMTQACIPTPSDMQRDVVRGILARGMELLDAKGHDYAGDDSTFINFTLTGIILDWAVSRGLQQEDLAFVSFIATKLARLIELRGSGKTPKNEAIEDTCMDLANYAALWGGWILTKTRQPKNLQQCLHEYSEELTAKIQAERLQVAKEYEEWANGDKWQMPGTVREDVSKPLQTKRSEALLSELASLEYPNSDAEKTMQEVDEIAIAAMRLREPASQEYPLVGARERHENFWAEMTKKYVPVKDEQPDLDLEAAKEATGYDVVEESCHTCRFFSLGTCKPHEGTVSCEDWEFCD